MAAYTHQPKNNMVEGGNIEEGNWQKKKCCEHQKQYQNLL